VHGTVQHGLLCVPIPSSRTRWEPPTWRHAAGCDALITRHTTGLPVDVALGAARYEEVYPLGYPHPGLGGRTFVHRWGPFASALRSLGVGRFGRVWDETDLHYAP